MQRAITPSGKLLSYDSGVFAIAIVLTFLTGYLNTHTDELMVTIPWLLVATTALGLAQPRRPWLWALLIGAAVPGSQILFYLLGLRVPYPNNPADIGTSFVVFVPAFFGAYLAAGMRRLAASGSPPA